METEKTFEEKIEDLKSIRMCKNINPEIISVESIDHLIRAHELKYIENVIEVDEENKLAIENIDDFLGLDNEIQVAAMAAYEHAQRDPNYFSKPGVEQSLILPVQILQNIDNKKNEAKIKTWKVDYHARIIDTLNHYRFFAGKKLVKEFEFVMFQNIIKFIKNIVKK